MVFERTTAVAADGPGPSLLPATTTNALRAPEGPASLLGKAMRRPRSVATLAGGLLVGVVASGGLGLPLVAAATVGLGCSLYVALIAHDISDPGFARRTFGPLGAPLRPTVHPDQLEAAELHAAYIGILRGYETVRTVLQASHGVVDDLRDVYLRCGDLVDAAGRVARNGDALQRYLGSQTSIDLEAELTRLDGLAAAAHDARAASTYRHAAQARRRQLELHRQIEGLYDRVKARLAVVTSFLAAMEAVVVKLNALDVERLHDDGIAISDQLDELRGEIDILEGTLEDALAEPD